MRSQIPRPPADTSQLRARAPKLFWSEKRATLPALTFVRLFLGMDRHIGARGLAGVCGPQPPTRLHLVPTWSSVGSGWLFGISPSGSIYTTDVGRCCSWGFPALWP